MTVNISLIDGTKITVEVPGNLVSEESTVFRFGSVFIPREQVRFWEEIAEGGKGDSQSV